VLPHGTRRSDPVAYGDLATLADVKAWLQQGQNSFPANDDALLSRLITATSHYIQTWLSRPIAASDYLETRDGTGGQRLQFGIFPVLKVQSLTINGQVVPLVAASGAAGYNFSATQLTVQGYEFFRGAQNIVVAYSAGYSTIPPDINQACIELVALRYRERSRVGEISKSMGGAETVSYSQKDLSDPIKTLLQQYRLVSPVVTLQPPQAATGFDPAMVVGLL
jgi:hypothetical protein